MSRLAILASLLTTLVASILLCSAGAGTAAAETGSVIASDDFNRADELPLVVGGNWQQPFGGGLVNLTSNQVVGASGEALYYWQGSGTFNDTLQSSRARVNSSAGQVGVLLLGATNQALVVSWGQARLYIYWYLNGSYQGMLADEPYSLANNSVIEAVLKQGMIYAKVDGLIVKAVPNTTTLSGGKPGFETFQSGAELDDWQGGPPLEYAITGTIIENGNGLSDVLVAASVGFIGVATTDGDGEYTITGVLPGTQGIVLTPTLAGHTMSPLTRTVLGSVIGDVSGQDFLSTPNGATATEPTTWGQIKGIFQ